LLVDYIMLVYYVLLVDFFFLVDFLAGWLPLVDWLRLAGSIFPVDWSRLAGCCIFLFECLVLLLLYYVLLDITSCSFLLALIFGLDDEGSMFLRNVGKLLQDYFTSHLRYIRMLFNYRYDIESAEIIEWPKSQLTSQQTVH
jgi:hypothetical protein